VQLKLPLAQPPDWFVEQIVLEPQQKVVVVDDDASIHQIWKSRLEHASCEYEIELLSFGGANQLQIWLLENEIDISNTHFLVDYELIGESKTGLDLIEALNLSKHAIITTSHFEDADVLKRCENLGVSLLPKSMVAFIPIELRKSFKNYDAVLIDDDELVHATWEMFGKDKKIIMFFTEQDFLNERETISFDAPIYVDCHLGSFDGRKVAKNLFDLGFTNIHLATGLATVDTSMLPWLKGVIGKTPPWAEEVAW
jgi:hypothetical protein